MIFRELQGTRQWIGARMECKPRNLILRTNTAREGVNKHVPVDAMSYMFMTERWIT